MAELGYGDIFREFLRQKLVQPYSESGYGQTSSNLYDLSEMRDSASMEEGLGTPEELARTLGVVPILPENAAPSAAPVDPVPMEAQLQRNPAALQTPNSPSATPTRPPYYLDKDPLTPFTRALEAPIAPAMQGTAPGASQGVVDLILNGKTYSYGGGQTPEIDPAALASVRSQGSVFGDSPAPGGRRQSSHLMTSTIDTPQRRAERANDMTGMLNEAKTKAALEFAALPPEQKAALIAAEKRPQDFKNIAYRHAIERIGPPPAPTAQDAGRQMQQSVKAAAQAAGREVGPKALDQAFKDGVAEWESWNQKREELETTVFSADRSPFGDLGSIPSEVK